MDPCCPSCFPDASGWVAHHGALAGDGMVGEERGGNVFSHYPPQPRPRPYTHAVLNTSVVLVLLLPLVIPPLRLSSPSAVATLFPLLSPLVLRVVLSSILSFLYPWFYLFKYFFSLKPLHLNSSLESWVNFLSSRNLDCFKVHVQC